MAGLFLLAGCGGPADEFEEREYFGEFEQATEEGKADGLGQAAVPVSADNSDTAVWTVRNQWTDTDTNAARQAGLAWPVNSGLDWNQKYARWVAGLPKIDTYDDRYKTFEITTPEGKVLQAPVLECAETAYFLRATFASWYQLPFFLEAVDSERTRVFMGHFGWRTKTGRYKNSNLFRKWYVDYQGGDYTADNWPQDARLRTKKLFGANDDYQPFLGDGLRAGAYFDELYLNKRVGHFMILLLSNFGSIHLADSSNTFNLAPEAVREGDVLIERWQRRGIGHTLVVKSVTPLDDDKLEAELISGSMPRRQPKWENPTASKRYFTLDETGGQGTNYDGVEYAKLGGGLKRFRTAMVAAGKYVNTITAADRDHWISNTNYEEIAARPDEFDELLAEVPPEEKRDAVLAIIEDKRDHLRRYPASCSARIGREGAFAELYQLMDERFGLDREAVDRQYRQFEDYVFAELVYQQSKTCCWNSSTDAMYEIAMDYNLSRQEEAQACLPPEVFMWNGGYPVFEAHAANLGRADEWVAWSADESCPQSGVAVDTEADHQWTDFCDVRDDLLGTGSSGCGDDRFEPNDGLASAAAIASGTHDNLSICSGNADWYRISAAEGRLVATIFFSHRDGDLDLELTDATGTKLDTSTSISDTEKVEFDVRSAGDYYLHVYGYREAGGDYRLEISAAR